MASLYPHRHPLALSPKLPLRPRSRNSRQKRKLQLQESLHVHLRSIGIPRHPLDHLLHRRPPRSKRRRHASHLNHNLRPAVFLFREHPQEPQAALPGKQRPRLDIQSIKHRIDRQTPTPEQNLHHHGLHARCKYRSPKPNSAQHMRTLVRNQTQTRNQ